MCATLCVNEGLRASCAPLRQRVYIQDPSTTIYENTEGGARKKNDVMNEHKVNNSKAWLGSK